MSYGKSHLDPQEMPELRVYFPGMKLTSQQKVVQREARPGTEKTAHWRASGAPRTGACFWLPSRCLWKERRCWLFQSLLATFWGPSNTAKSSYGVEKKSFPLHKNIKFVAIRLLLKIKIFLGLRHLNTSEFPFCLSLSRHSGTVSACSRLHSCCAADKLTPDSVFG